MSLNSFFMPAEWVNHQSVWLAWPSDASLWLENLEAAQEEFTALCHAIQDIDPVTKKPRGEKINLLVTDEKVRAQAEKALRGLNIEYFIIPYGDIWLRDTAPLFLMNAKKELTSLCFKFNGWGEKYVFSHDNELSQNIAAVMNKTLGLKKIDTDYICEGGSLELDGEGTCLTSKQCLLNDNRNPSLNQMQIEEKLKSSLGVSKILWLGDGLINDHTDGHIDTIARFASPGVALCMKAMGKNDPNELIMNQIEKDLNSMTDAKGRKLKVGTVPSPGAILNSEGDLMPASYMNFYISNTSVIVPTYGSHFDTDAVQQIAEYFPGRKTIGLPGKSILTGGGAFHCISQQVPSF